MKEAQLEAEVKLLRKENEALRRHIAVLQAEVYGARLAAKYLDKELAGRCVNMGTLVLSGDKWVCNEVDFYLYGKWNVNLCPKSYFMGGYSLLLLT